MRMSILIVNNYTSTQCPIPGYGSHPLRPHVTRLLPTAEYPSLQLNSATEFVPKAPFGPLIYDT